jgi:xanthine/CO dehydrogenase XdhC/CoxF family maturation factor
MEKAILPKEVIAVLNQAGIKFVLVGAHGLAGWMEAPRATQDVDVVVGPRHHKKAVRTLLAAFPHLEEFDLPVVTRLRDPETKAPVIDVIKPNQPLFRVALKHIHEVASYGQVYHVPTIEMALALKFAPMVSPVREDAKKYLDAHDFITMVKLHPDLDVTILEELGDLVYPEGGKELLEKVRQARTGEKLNL